MAKKGMWQKSLDTDTIFTRRRQKVGVKYQVLVSKEDVFDSEDGRSYTGSEERDWLFHH